MANPFAKYVQPQENENPFAKYAQPEPATDAVENPFAKFVAPTEAPKVAPAEEKGFISRNIGWAGDALLTGWENMLSSFEGIKQSEADEYITKLEEKYGPGAVNAPPDKQQIYREAVQLAEKSKAERQRISTQQQERYERTPQREATQEFKSAITGFERDELSFLDSAAKAGSALISNPVGVITDLGLESTPASLAMLASAVLARFGGGSTLAAAGAGGTVSAVTEFGNEYAARRDKGMSHDKAWEDAATKSGVIGLLDAVSMNSAGKAAGVVMDALSGTKRVGKAAKEVLKETGKQAGLGAAGEAGGSLAIGEVPNPAAVIAEAVGEVFGAPLEAVGTYRATKPSDARRKGAQTEEDRLIADLDAQADREEAAGEESIDEFIAQQRAGVSAQPGAGVAGVSGVGAAEAAGVPDTGVPKTPTEGGLAGVGAAPTVAGERAGVEPSALEEYYPDMDEAPTAQKPPPPVFALPESFEHGTDYLTAQKIIQQGKLIPDAGKRMYTYSQFGRKAVYLTDRNGWWLDSNKAAEGRAAVYDASVPFKLDPNANIREVNTQAELDAIAREIGEPDAAAMMRKLSVDNLDYEKHVRETKDMSFDEYVANGVKEQRERLQKYEAPDADTVIDIDSWAAQRKKQDDETGRSDIFGPESVEKVKKRILNSLRKEYNLVQNYEEQYKDADEVTQKLLDAGIDGIYIGPDFERIDPEEYDAYEAIQNNTQQMMPDAAPEEIYNAAVEEYKKVNPTFFDRLGNTVASDQLALFRPELAVVDRARLAAARPKPVLAADAYTRRPGETVDQYTARITAQPTSKLAPEILDLLRNNDLSGALRELAARFSAGPQIRTFYGELATRIADLNLPTEVRIGDQRNLTRRSIDAYTRPEQIRLFAYIRNKFPAYFDQYFKDYDKADALETVYAGLLNLSVDQVAKLGPVRAEYDTVKQAYIDSMPGVSANGAYYTVFDVLNLNDSVGRSNGLDYYTLMHESVHAATETLLNTPRDQRTNEQNEAIAQLEELYRLAQANTNFNYYGLTNLSEFIAEAFTNKKFQDFLKGIPYAPARTNIFSRFIQAVLNLVGMDNVAARTMVEAEKLFSSARPLQTLPAGPRFAGAKKPRIRGPISKPDTWRTAEQVTVSLTDLFNDALKGRRSWDEVLKMVGPAMWDTGTGTFRKALLGMANLRQIGDLTATKFPQIQGAIRMIEKMLAHRGKKLTQASDIVKAWTAAQAKSPKQSELVGRVMLEATIRGQNPSSLPTTDALRRAWDGLNPEFKKIYEDVRKFYADSVNEMVREMKQRAMGLPKAERQAMIRKINEQFGPDKLKQPYFPLRRFGTYWFQIGVGQNKEFYEFESRIDRELAMRNRRQQLSRGNAQQQKLAGTIAKGNGISELYNRNIGTTQVLKDVQEIIDGVGASDVEELRSELRDSLNQLIYLLLPQQSMRKMFINRKAIQGASADMLRVFATTAVHSAYQQSRFKYAQPFLNNLDNARDYVRQLPVDADTKAVYDDYIKEVEARAKTILSNEDTSMAAKVAGKASEATFYFMLSAPFTSILNVLGFAQVTMPYIGGRYGYAKTNAVILKNFGRYFMSMPSRTINPLRQGRYMETSFPSIAEGGGLDPLMQRAADRFIEEGQINISLTNDIFDIGERPSELYTGKYNAVKRAISGLFHQSERLNREVTLLTVFELAYDKFRNEPKKDLRGVVARDAAGNPIKNTDEEAFELAIAEAKDIAGLSLGDFTRQMKPRYFTSPLMSVLTKFKQYPVMATYAIARNFYYTFAAPFRTKEIEDFRKQLEADNLDPKVIEQRIAEADEQRKQIYKEGRRRLAGILGVTFLLGGIEAQPFFSILVGPIVKMLGNDDDDDEFFNWENWFKNYMEEELGGYAGSVFEQLGVDAEKAAKLGRKTGEAVGRGVVPAITGGSLADRVSLDPKNLWYREARYSPDVRESIIENVIANAGPVVGLGFNWIDAYKLMQEGQYQRAFEKAAPAIVSKPVSAARLSEEGAKTRGGVQLVDNFTATEIAMQAVGLQPERLAQAQKAAIEAKEKEQKILDRRDTIMNRLWMERDNPEGFDMALEEAGKFSERYPAKKIDYDSIRESFKKRTQEAAEAEAFGAKITKKLRPEVEPMLRYGRE